MNHATRYEHILGKLRGVKRRGRWWDAFCPVHETGNGHNRSLTCRVGDSGCFVLKCWAGCTFSSIAASLGLKEHDFFPDEPKNMAEQKKIAACYDYLDENGVALFQVVRLDPKGFRVRRRHQDGSWVWGITRGYYEKSAKNGEWYPAEVTDSDSHPILPEVRRVIYRLPYILAADPARTVLVVEGEKAADKLAAFGLVSTCCPGGAGKWHSRYSESLRSRNVTVLADNDAPGVLHAQHVCNALLGVARSVRYVMLPDLPPKGDVYDWLSTGKSKADLEHVIKGIPFLNEPIAFGPGTNPPSLSGDADTEHDVRTSAPTGALTATGTDVEETVNAARPTASPEVNAQMMGRPARTDEPEMRTSTPKPEVNLDSAFAEAVAAVHKLPKMQQAILAFGILNPFRGGDK